MPLPRRTLFGAGLAATLAGCAGPSSPAKPVLVEPDASAPAPPPGAVAPASKAAPYAQPVTDVLTRYLKLTRDNPHHPGYAGAVALVAVGGRPTLHAAVGDAVRYRAGPVELPAARRVRMRPDAIFDLASLTKVYTAIL
ncbi:MAG TPA: serine hydrolase, partial [Actinoplanes sp.]|nr:serine hydrolase [Actinoplanes sp.]